MSSVKTAYEEAWSIDSNKYTQSAVNELKSLFKTDHFQNMF